MHNLTEQKDIDTPIIRVEDFKTLFIEWAEYDKISMRPK